MINYQPLYNLVILLSFLGSMILTPKYGYDKGNEICFYLYNQTSPHNAKTDFLKISQTERDQIKRDIGVTSVLVADKITQGNAKISELRELQKATEDAADAFITYGQALELYGLIVVPPKLASMISGFLGVVACFFISFFIFNYLINSIFFYFKKTNKYTKRFSSITLRGPSIHIKIVYSFIRSIFRKQKKQQDIIYL